MRDSVSTSVNIKLFENKQDARLAHILKSKLVEIPLYIFENNDIENYIANLILSINILTYDT